MVYNRCVGTAVLETTARTRCGGSTSCSNTDYDTPSRSKSQRNPDVTPRSRSVMEEVHVLRAADQPRAGSTRKTEKPPDPGWGDQDGVPAGVSDRGHRVRRT